MIALPGKYAYPVDRMQLRSSPMMLIMDNPATIKRPLTAPHNRELAEIFRRMADCYRFLGPDERFRAQAYTTASRTLSNLAEPVDIYHHNLRKLDELKGVGESIAAKIEEYLDNGSIATYEALKKRVPFELLTLMDIEGIGPATVRILHQALGAENPEEVAAAIQNGTIGKVKGLSGSMIEKLSRALKLEKKTAGRIPLETALKMAAPLLETIKQIPGVKKAMIVGSIRRKRKTIGDIDIVLAASNPARLSIAKKIRLLPQVQRVLAAGQTRISLVLQQGIQADLRIVTPDEWGAALLYFTGSKEHNIRLRTMARNRGWKINEYGVFELEGGKKIAGETEEGIYALFGLSYIPPEKRLGGKELGKGE